MAFDSKKLLQEQYLIPIKIVLVYVVWKVFHHFAMLPGTPLNHFWIQFVYRLGTGYAAVTSVILSIIGLKSTSEGIDIHLIQSNKVVWVQDHCLAIPAMVVFVGSVIFFKGKWTDKAGFIIIGLLGIALINIIRLIFVSYAWVYLSDYFFKLHHSVIYVVATYGFIFLMITWWMNRMMRKDTLSGNLKSEGAVYFF